MNNILIGLIGVRDIIKDSAVKAIKQLYKKDMRIIMLTGDNEKTAQIIANKLGIKEVKANISPQDKAAFIKKLKQEGLVMMVGDGINDAISLAASDIGLSVATGTDIAINSADVVLMHDDLTKINDLMVISQKTIRNIKENLFWAFFYNLAMIPIALGVFNELGITINPSIAGLAMTISSLTVVFNALRLRKIKMKR
jgi:Cu+-exporting ATPase